MIKKGLYIVIEGIDGSGKSTQLSKLLKNLFPIKDVRCDRVSEPGGTPPGKIVREILIGDNLAEYQTPRCQVLGYNYARAMMVANIKRGLECGISIFSDRCFLSTFAYQHYGEGEDFETVKTICEYAVADCMPDKVFLLDVSVDEAKKRLRARSNEQNHYDTKDNVFFDKLSKGYLELAEVYPNMISVIDGEQHEELIARQIFEQTLNLFREKRGESNA